MENVMSFKRLTLAIAAASIPALTCPGTVMASQFDRINESPRLMFSVQKSFGRADRQNDPSLAKFSLRMEKPVTKFSRDIADATLFQTAVPMLSWSFNSAGRHQLNALGSFGFDSTGAADSSADGSLPESSTGGGPLTYILAGLGVFAVLCATETVFCEEDDEYTPGSLGAATQ